MRIALIVLAMLFILVGGFSFIFIDKTLSDNISSGIVIAVGGVFLAKVIELYIHK